jgi:hypothetical protein
MSPTVFEQSQVHEVLRSLPRQGWVSGRDRALLALSQTAGIEYPAIAELVVGDLTIAYGVAVIRTSMGTVELAGDPDTRLCGPCALSRWAHMLDMTAIYSDRAISAAVIARSTALSAHSPHVCENTPALSEATRRSTLFPPVDQWGLLTEAGSEVVRQPVLPIQQSGWTAVGSSGGTGRRLGRPDVRSRAERLEHRTRELVGQQPA